MKVVAWVAAISIVGAIPSGQARPVVGHAWGQPNAGLRVGIATNARDASPPGDVHFEVAFENTGTTDFVLNLGHMFANGKVMFPSSIRLALTDPSGHVRELEYRDRNYPGVAGRVDDFTVALRAGSLHTIRTTIDHYWSPATKEFELRLTAGRYRIVARFQGEGARTNNLDLPGVALLNFWKGLVQSSPLEFVVSGKSPL